MRRDEILNEVSIERDRQEERHGALNRKCNLWQLIALLGEESGEVFKETIDAYDFEKRQFRPIAARHVRNELIQVAAVAVQIVELLEEGVYFTKEELCYACKNEMIEQEAGGAT